MASLQEDRVDGPNGPIEVRVVGRGVPVTVFAHGLASSIDETRPFGSAVAGTRVFMHFRGHGASASPPRSWSYAELADELMSVVQRYGATRALGVSMGAGAILSAASRGGRAFERLVLLLPGAFDAPRSDPGVRHLDRLAALVGARDPEALAAALIAEQPRGARERADVAVWARRRAETLSTASVQAGLRGLVRDHPVEPGADLSSIGCPVLVVGQQGDAAHPAELARAIAARLPNASLRVFDADGLLWAHRAELRTLLATFLSR